jgi:hypothetical protein
MTQSFAPKPRGPIFAELGDFVQHTLLNFGLHSHTIEIFELPRLSTTSRGE